MRAGYVLVIVLTLSGCATAWGCLAGAGAGVLLAAIASSAAGASSDARSQAASGGLLFGTVCGCTGAGVALATRKAPKQAEPDKADAGQPTDYETASTIIH